MFDNLPDNFKEKHKNLLKHCSPSSPILYGKMYGFSIEYYDVVQKIKDFEFNKTKIDEEWWVNLIDSYAKSDEHMTNILVNNLYKQNNQNLNKLFINALLKGDTIKSSQILFSVIKNYKLTEQQAKTIAEIINEDNNLITAHFDNLDNQHNIKLLATAMSKSEYNYFLEYVQDVNFVKDYIDNINDDENTITAILNNKSIPHNNKEFIKKFNFNLDKLDPKKSHCFPDGIFEPFYGVINDNLFLSAQISDDEYIASIDLMNKLFKFDSADGEKFNRLYQNIINCLKASVITRKTSPLAESLMNNMSTLITYKNIAPPKLLDFMKVLNIYDRFQLNLLDDILSKKEKTVTASVENQLLEYLNSKKEFYEIDKIVEKTFGSTGYKFKKSAAKNMIKNNRINLMANIIVSSNKLKEFENLSNEHYIKQMYSAINNSKDEKIKAIVNLAIKQATETGLTFLVAQEIDKANYICPRYIFSAKYFKSYEDFIKPLLEMEEFLSIHNEMKHFLDVYGKAAELSEIVIKCSDILSPVVNDVLDGDKTSRKRLYINVNDNCIINKERLLQKLSVCDDEIVKIFEDRVIAALTKFEGEELYRKIDNISVCFDSISERNIHEFEDVMNMVLELNGCEPNFKFSDTERV